MRLQQPFLVLFLCFIGPGYGQECASPGCCDEDCCGEFTIHSVAAGGCIPNAMSSGWDGTYSDAHQLGCKLRQCCEQDCCKEGTAYNPTEKCCDGDILFAFKDSVVVIGVRVTEFQQTGLCLPTTGFMHVIDAGTPIGMTGAFCASANNAVATCQNQLAQMNRFELTQVPTQIFNQHRVLPGMAAPVIPPQLPTCLLNYNVRYSVECGPAKLQASASSPSPCFKDADGTVVCPVARNCDNGCFALINNAVDVLQAEAAASCGNTPLPPGVPG